MSTYKSESAGFFFMQVSSLTKLDVKTKQKFWTKNVFFKRFTLE